MTEASLPVPASVEAPTKKSTQNQTLKLARYIGIRLITLLIAVTIGVYLTILIANMGGYVDEILKGQIRERISVQIGLDPTRQNLTMAERNKLIDELVTIEEHRLGLDQPFLMRSFRFLGHAMVLNLGRAQHMASDSGSKLVRNIILERLPPTLLLMSSSSLLLFFITLFFALYLSRNYGNLLDKLVIALSPTSAAPAWFYGIFLLLLFASVLGWLPFGGMVAAPPPDAPIAYALSVLRHLILPVVAWIISGFFAGVYGYRTFFLIFSMEDYVELARAKGLTSKDIERRYVLRPTLPNIITNFALTLIGLWNGATILETVFNWPGIGRLVYQAIGLYDSPVIIGTTVINAYLLAITVFLLDFIYALVDPRVRVGGGGSRS